MKVDVTDNFIQSQPMILQVITTLKLLDLWLASQSLGRALRMNSFQLVLEQDQTSHLFEIYDA